MKDLERATTHYTAQADHARDLAELRQAKARIDELEAEVALLKVDAERYEYILDCDAKAIRKFVPDLDVTEFKAERRASHDFAIDAAKGA